MSNTTQEFTTTVDVPTKARLVLRTEAGAEFPATKKVIEGFGFVHSHEAYARFKSQLCRALGVEELPDEGWANTLRYMVECALFYNIDFDYSPNPDDPDDEDTQSATRMIRELRALNS